MQILQSRTAFLPHETFEYGARKKRQTLLLSSVTALFLLLLTLYFFLFADASSLPFVSLLNSAASKVIAEISGRTLLGAFFASLFGGLFFITVPTEAVFIMFLKADLNPYLLFFVYISGFVLSYTLNYFVGLKLAGLSKKIITPRKFYRIKGYINRHGALAVFVFNVLPLPSQALTTILGVFRYNLARFYLFFLLGQAIKYSLILLSYSSLF
ncbi:hypothetical protein D6764_00230 [Candidatus Woesearchaeota archaeon]|nr:MAG: hypothetical protein D6764_00230 [Candidatus Woesearchaeota archaeon]